MSQPDNMATDAVALQRSAHDSSLAAPDGFAAFYRDSYREVVKAAMIVGATFEEAEDAASETFLSMLKRWPLHGAPLSYARKAVVNNFIKDKSRGYHRVSQRLIERGPASVRHEGAEDAELCALEGQEWIEAILGRLSPASAKSLSGSPAGSTTTRSPRISASPAK